MASKELRRTARDPWTRLPVRVRVALRKARIKLNPFLGALIAGISDPRTLVYFKRLPVLPKSLRRVRPQPVWSEPSLETPASLRGVAGIERDPQAEQRAFEKQPLHVYSSLHPENIPRFIEHAWPYVLPNAGRLARAFARAARLRSADGGTYQPVAKNGGSPDGVVVERSSEPPRSEGGQEKLGDERLTARIREEGRRLGLSAVGIAAYDRKYTFVEHAGTHDVGSVLVCLYEQDWAATQTAPSARAERAAFASYAGLMERVVGLADFVERQGPYRAHPHSYVGETMALHYGVEAGLGQLGMNGQLLTPQAGSRARLAIITTNVELVHDAPVDYGLHAICDACQVCVRRCPVGAIPNHRKEYRGITKAKIKTERCFPVVATVEGCAICMKTCPVQRYGLDAVHEHYVNSGGKILGKDTDELEGFTWPLDGLYYGPDRKPDAENRRQVLNPPHWHPMDPTRTAPPSTSLDIATY